MLEIKNVTKRYGRFTAVDDLSFEVPAGQIFGFLGPNGAGKTTTMKMITGLIQPTQGQITVDGIDVVQSPVHAKSVVGYIPDRPYVHDRLTALEYLYFIAGLYGMKRKDTAQRAAEMLALFELVHKADDLVESFSHGMKQRLVMASVLLHRPKLLVVDEPMVGLDPRGARRLKQLLQKEAHEHGLAILMSTHTLEVAEEVCDTVGILHHGRLVVQGPPDVLRQRQGLEDEKESNLEALFLLLTNPENTNQSETLPLSDAP
ncbi:MAG: ABC transporter ATP-binding protein [Bradymonadia bacterium]